MNGYPYGKASYGNNGAPAGGAPDGGNMFGVAQDGMTGAMGSGQTLDDIVNQNADVMRRQSIPPQYAGVNQGDFDENMRRMSGMMEFNGGSPAGPMTGYQFDPSLAIDGGESAAVAAAIAPRTRGGDHSRRQSGVDIALNTNFPNIPQDYSGIMSANAAFSSPVHQQSAMDMGMDSPYVASAMGGQMDYSVNASGGPNPAGPDAMHMNMYSQPQFNQRMAQAPPGPPSQTSNAAHTPSHDLGGGTPYGNRPGVNALRHPSRSQSMRLGDTSSPRPKMSTPRSSTMGGTTPTQPQQPSPRHRESRDAGFPAQPQHPVKDSLQDRGINTASQYDGVNGPIPISNENFNPNNQGFAWEPREGGWPSTLAGKPHSQTSYRGAYSSTGFDMLGVLMRVATRPNPRINIGSVDLSCAFVVCDAGEHDFPIVHISDNFERLTGYTKHMILGRNCRFLQSPDGNVTAGVRRKYVDDDSVLYLKNMINMRQEAQISLINYRRGGQPFMNLLTMIPISWEDSTQVKYFVGFQVDLVEQPSAVTNKNPDGTYSINYQRGMSMPPYVLNAPEIATQAEPGQTVPRDDVSTILSTIGSGESEYAKRMWDKVLLENTDDVVHVLSLKGLFQWVSPSSSRVLEYEPSELIGMALSSVCHPSDIVPTTRSLKDTSTGASVDVAFRIRRKNSGYMWFEAHGSLHTEQGKGRKSIIMVGRERPVYTLSKSDILATGGIGENELWTKMSTSGMFLFVSSNVRQLLDRQPEEMVGISIQSLTRQESRGDFNRILEHARTGKKASVKHEMINRRGQVLSAYTTLYPGDALEGQKPTFIVAQTRLIKYSRGTPSIRPPMYSKDDRGSNESGQSVVSGLTGMTDSRTHRGDNTPQSSTNGGRYMNTNGSAITYSGQNGLTIGRQDDSLASEDNLFDELKTTKPSSWQYEIRQLEKKNRMLAEEVQALIAAKKKRKRRKGAGNQQKDCANCHTRVTPEWRRGPSGQRDLCNSCGLRWAKVNGRVSPRTSSQHSAGGSDKASKTSASPRHTFTSPPAGAGGPSSATPGVAGSGSATIGIKHESPGGQGAAGSGRESPRAQRPPDGHSASMEGASGVPDSIDEGVEPD
ncbi:hypothetical protein B0A48_03089 [Cryoendolithus antarcticus]|uniref:White collar 1 protein n=1 Tax=Cryoendolithus antarcticus TaxID=1507870 RepID=A0A1V8TM40_9PEZI|nr:hypothetical protein B0A48_03089 [Cryoendolithus antarcticus]